MPRSIPTLATLAALPLTLAAVLATAGCSAAAAPGADGADPSGPTSSSSSTSPSTDDAGTPITTSPGDDAGVSLSNPTGSDAASPPSTGAPPGTGGGKTDDAGSPAPVDGSAPPSSTKTDYAPYFPTWIWGGSGYAITGLADLASKSGLKEVTIAFVLSNGGCNTTQDIEQNASDVKAFIAAGGHVKASFGGADGTYIDAKCTTAAAWATALEDFVDSTGITDLDFDIEQDPVLTDSVNQMRGQALKLAQDAKGIQVAFTLAANPHTSSSEGGLTSQGISVVSSAISAGVKVSHVNLMTMDYGDSFAGKPLAPVAIGSLTDANAQLLKAVPGLTKAQAWAMLGVIPMIGKNDDSEVFSLADAKTLAAFAETNALGLVSFWSIDRDQVCPKGGDFNSCSTVDTSNFAFNAILSATAE